MPVWHVQGDRKCLILNARGCILVEGREERIRGRGLRRANAGAWHGGAVYTVACVRDVERDGDR